MKDRILFAYDHLIHINNSELFLFIFRPGSFTEPRSYTRHDRKLRYIIYFASQSLIWFILVRSKIGAGSFMSFEFMKVLD